MADDGESSSFLPKSTNEKPVVVRVKRKAAQSIVEALWIEINERPSKKPSLDLEKLAITEPSAEGLEFKDFGKLAISESSGKEVVNKKKVLVRHVETISSSKALYDVVQSLLPDSSVNFERKTKIDERKLAFQKDNKQDKPKARARQNQEALAKNARFEQIWRSRKQTKGARAKKELHETCRLYDVVRVDSEEISRKPQVIEDTFLEEHKLMASFMPLLREFIPSAAEEIESDALDYVSQRVAPKDEYVYDVYTVKDEIDETDEALNPFPLVQVDDDEEFFYDGPSDSDYATDDSNAEDNPNNDYPDEEDDMSDSNYDEDEEDEDEDEDTEDENEVTEDDDESDMDSLNPEDIIPDGLRQEDMYMDEADEVEYAYEDVIQHEFGWEHRHL